MVIALMKRYHDAVSVRGLDEPLARAVYVEQLSGRLALADSTTLGETFESIADQASDDTLANPTLTHGDLNASNFIRFADGKLGLID